MGEIKKVAEESALSPGMGPVRHLGCSVREGKPWLVFGCAYLGTKEQGTNHDCSNPRIESS